EDDDEDLRVREFAEPMVAAIDPGQIKIRRMPTHLHGPNPALLGRRRPRRRRGVARMSDPTQNHNHQPDSWREPQTGQGICPPMWAGPRKLNRARVKPRQRHSLTVTVLTSVYCCKPYSPSSRPMPDCLNPPNGA